VSNITKRDLFVDFDGTICNTIKAIVELYNEDFKYYKKFKPLEWYQINTWDFLECKCAKPEYINMYFNQPRFYERLEFMESAKEVLDKLKEKFNIHIVSMGYSPNLKGKELWIKENIPYADFIGVNFKEHDDKAHVIMGVDSILIDDSAVNLETSNADIKICYGDIYPWNENYQGIRKFNWTEIYDFLMN
jgi:5'(3')-deoxyribonucleotidase